MRGAEGGRQARVVSVVAVTAARERGLADDQDYCVFLRSDSLRVIGGDSTESG